MMHAFVALPALPSAVVQPLSLITDHETLTNLIVDPSLGWIVLALLLTLWAFLAQNRFNAQRESARVERAFVRRALALRDGLLNSVRDPVLVWNLGAGEPLSFRNAADLLNGCLAGADGGAVLSAIRDLKDSGGPFVQTARHADGSTVSLQGFPLGDCVVAVMHREEAPLEAEPDYRAVLDAMPMPVWLRDENLRLCWANQAFLAASGNETLEAAQRTNIAFDRSERDLAAVARDSGEPVNATRYAAVKGERNALSFSHCPLPDKGVAGVARIHTKDTADHSSHDRTSLAEALNQLTAAIAIFGPDRRLIYANRSYAETWRLDEDWLHTHPDFSEILDRLREARLLPEQRDFAAWKAKRFAFTSRDEHRIREVWYLPNGRTLQADIRSLPKGGLALVFEDIGERLRLETSYNALVKVQQATLDTLQEGIAVFGPDARLKLYNAAFAKTWRLDGDELLNGPHLSRIAEACALRFGPNEIWQTVTSAIGGDIAIPNEQRTDFERSDGRILSLSLTRLPDGSTLASFADATDLFRLQAALREAPEAA